MSKSIIIEGPNGAGKTTLANRLAGVLEMEVIHAGPSPGDSVEAMSACVDQIRSLQKCVIMDRVTPISRQVYEEGEPWLDMMLKVMLREADVIYCVGKGKFTHKEYYPPGHYEKVVKGQMDIRERYVSIMATIPHTVYDFEENECMNDLLRRL